MIAIVLLVLGGMIGWVIAAKQQGKWTTAQLQSMVSSADGQECVPGSPDHVATVNSGEGENIRYFICFDGQAHYASAIYLRYPFTNQYGPGSAMSPYHSFPIQPPTQ